jgi:hypothetical protein
MFGRRNKKIWFYEPANVSTRKDKEFIHSGLKLTKMNRKLSKIERYLTKNFEQWPKMGNKNRVGIM